MKRSAGILMPISALPSNYGIGTLGIEAYKFVDFLVEANQSYWQVLPIGHTSYGDSPYQCFSSFAGNPYFIDLDILVEDKLLTKEDLKDLKNDNVIDYGYLYETRYDVLYKAYLNGTDRYNAEFNEFLTQNKSWVIDYALFMAIKKYYNNVSWLDWPDLDIKNRKKKSINKYSTVLEDDIRFYEFIQFLFYKQFYELKKYANDNNIKIIGDMPIYAALDSCDVWANPKQFQLRESDLYPKAVAGVPPDYFSEDGQLWGNPLYDWDYMKKDKYKWWINRLKGISKCFDVIRIDHFIGFERYYAIPYGDLTAKNGAYIKGPSNEFIDILKNKFKNTEFIAEDLGTLDEDCLKLIIYAGYPGMRVLEFSEIYDPKHYHMPNNYVQNCVSYVSTHDNVPVCAWIDSLDVFQLDYISKYFNLSEKEGYNWGLIKACSNSIANLFICQIQDYLGLNEESTTNKPGTIGNWKYRVNKKQLTKKLAHSISLLIYESNRARNHNQRLIDFSKI